MGSVLPRGDLLALITFAEVRAQSPRLWSKIEGTTWPSSVELFDRKAPPPAAAAPSFSWPFDMLIALDRSSHKRAASGTRAMDRQLQTDSSSLRGSVKGKGERGPGPPALSAPGRGAWPAWLGYPARPLLRRHACG